MNSGGIRADINAGPITYGEAFSVQPFANVLVTMDMTGLDIEDLIEQQFNGGNGILQIPASLTYTRTGNGVLNTDGIDTPAGDTASNIQINGVDLDLGGHLPCDGEQLPRRRR